jgi:hypothetical protein
MAKVSRALNKTKFQTGDKPTEADFTDLIDSAVIWNDDIDTDGGLAGNSDLKIPTQKAVKSYVDGAISNYFLGFYASLVALQTAHPTSTAGRYAYVDAGVGNDPQYYVWDVNDASWKLTGGSPVSAASETVEGIVERATQSETDTGTDDSRYITPLKLSTWSGLLGKVLTGLSLATNAAITASDTILSALGKLQKQITDLITTVAGKEPSLGNPDVDGKVLSSTAAGVRSWITAGGSSSDASETVKGIAEIATQTEVNTGTDDTRFVTPLKLSSRPIPLTQLDNQAALTVLANATNASAKPTAVAATTAERVFGRNASNALAFVQVATNYIADLAVSTAKIAANAVTRAKLSQSPGYTVIGNPTGSTADPTDWEAVDLYSRTATATDYTVLATDTKVVVTSTAAARTMTIGFAASSVTAGHEILFKDESNGAATNNITITPNGSDTIEDGTINTNGGVLKIYSDGVSKWWKIYKQ